MGYLGNLGGRADKFQMNDQDYYLVESQIARGVWSSWRIVLTRGIDSPLRQIDFALPDEFVFEGNGFANPKITTLEKPDGTQLFLITIFVHGTLDIGEFIYVIDKY